MYLVPVVLSAADDVLLGVDPVQLFVQRVVVDRSHVPQVVDRQDDVGTLLLVDHHAVDGRLLTEQQEGGRSCKEKQTGRRLLPFKKQWYSNFVQ